MPDRILRAAILSSDRVNRLKWPEEVFYRRLMSVVDDYGRYDGRDAILRTALYPLKVDSVREADISLWKRCVADAGLIVLYTVDGKEYLQVNDFRQRTRSESKWPEPSAVNCQQAAVNCPHDDSTPPSSDGHPRPYSNAHADSESNSTNTVTVKRSVFVPPTQDEVSQHCRERGSPVDPIAFWNFYESKGWMVGKSKMKDWKRSVVTWERNRNGGGTNGPGGGSGGNRGQARLRGTGLIEQLEAEEAAARVSGDAG
jgi:hypothetical protein